MTGVSMEDLESALRQGLQKKVRNLSLALGAASLAYLGLGVLVMRGVVAFPAKASKAVQAGADPLLMLGLGALACGALYLSVWLPERNLRQLDLAGALSRGLTLPNAGGRLTDRGAIVGLVLARYFLLRAALIEAVAVLGLVLIFIVGPLAQEQPLYQLALLPSAVVPLALMVMAPSEDRLRRFFERRFLQGA